MDPLLIAAIDRANRSCPDAYSTIVRNVLNVNVTQNPETELPATLCDAARLINMCDSLATNVYYGTFTGACLTLISGLMSLLTLSAKRFNAVSFIYYRVICVADVLYAALALPSLVTFFYDRAWESFHLVTYMRFFNDRLENSFADFVDLLVAWMSIDRALCHFPNLYGRFSQKKVAYCLTASLYLVALAWNVPTVFMQTVAFSTEIGDRYVFKKTEFGNGPGAATFQSAFNVWIVIRAVLLGSAAVLTSAILMRNGVRKREMAKTMGETSATSNSLLQQVKRNRFLCLLLLLEASPLIVYSVMKLFILTPHMQFNIPNFTQLPFDEAQSAILYYRIMVPLVIANRTIRIAAHALQFFIYCLFLKTFRNAALNNFKMLLQAFARNNASVSDASNR